MQVPPYLMVNTHTEIQDLETIFNRVSHHKRWTLLVSNRCSLTVDSESRGRREPVGLLTLFGQLLVSKLGMKIMIDLEKFRRKCRSMSHGYKIAFKRRSYLTQHNLEFPLY